MTLSDEQQALCTGHDVDFSDLKALFINGSLKRSSEFLHTEQLMKVSQAIMDANGAATERVRAVDLSLPPGVQPDMREHGFEHDDWPALSEKSWPRISWSSARRSGWVKQPRGLESRLPLRP